jgi:hypothetical protein
MRKGSSFSRFHPEMPKKKKKTGATATGTGTGGRNKYYSFFLHTRVPWTEPDPLGSVYGRNVRIRGRSPDGKRKKLSDITMFLGSRFMLGAWERVWFNVYFECASGNMCINC